MLNTPNKLYLKCFDKKNINRNKDVQNLGRLRESRELEKMSFFLNRPMSKLHTKFRIWNLENSAFVKSKLCLPTLLHLKVMICQSKVGTVLVL